MLFSFDAESDGLYGEVFAIAAVVVNEACEVIESFAGKSYAADVRSPWVRDHVLPHIADLPDYPTREALREAFWAFYQAHKHGCTILADVPCPVEAGLLRACVEANLAEREFEAPFPLIDVASVLHAHGVDPLIDRMQFSGHVGRPHHPLDDALASVKCYWRLANQSPDPCRR